MLLLLHVHVTRAMRDKLVVSSVTSGEDGARSLLETCVIEVPVALSVGEGVRLLQGGDTIR